MHTSPRSTRTGEGYFAHKKRSPRKTLPSPYAWGHMVVLGGMAIFDERGTPVRFQRNNQSTTAPRDRTARDLHLTCSDLHLSRDACWLSTRPHVWHRLHPLTSQWPHTPYRWALRPSKDFFGYKFKPLATGGIPTGGSRQQEHILRTRHTLEP